MKLMQRSIETTNLVELCEWCRDYHRYTPYPSNPLERFHIGLYQIHQGMAWEAALSGERDNRGESFVAAAVHFVCCAESLNLSVWAESNKGVIIDSWETKDIDYKKLMSSVSEASQQIFYGWKAYKDGYQRKSRYSKDKLQKLLWHLVEQLICAVRSDDRERCMGLATSIMTNRL